MGIVKPVVVNLGPAGVVPVKGSVVENVAPAGVVPVNGSVVENGALAGVVPVNGAKSVFSQQEQSQPGVNA